MRRIFAALLAVLAVAGTAACEDEEPATPATTAAPTNRSVAPGVTRDGTQPTAEPGTGIALEDAFPGMPPVTRPVELLQLPREDTVLIASQEGVILAVDPSNPGAPGTAYDGRDRTSRDGNEEGLLGLALDPAYPDRPYAYVYYSAAGGERRTVLSRMEASGTGPGITIDPGSELVILEVPQPYSNHKGGKVAFGPDGMLYVGLGDGGSAGDPHGNGQSTDGELLGNILRLDVSDATVDARYAIPDDNPFAAGGGEPEIYAWGLRNPWRFSFDRDTGTLWAGDVGQDEFEEIDIIRAGGNYGWNVVEGDECYSPAACDRSGFEAPVATYSHSLGCSVTGGFVYRGDSDPGLRGTYLYADYCSGTIWGLDADAAAEGSTVEPAVLLESGLQITSFGEDAAGEIYVLAFDGKVYRVAAE